MTFRVHLAEYEACGRCGHTWPFEGVQSQLQVSTSDLARAITSSHISRILGRPDLAKSIRGIMLLTSNLLRIRAPVRRGGRHLLFGHSIMDAHHGSARRNLSEEFGIAMATSFLTKVHSCREHYNIDAVGKQTAIRHPIHNAARYR